MLLTENILEDYYQTLSLPFPSNPEEIKAAYKKLVRVYHPDKNIGNEAAAAQEFSKINFAFQVLGNEYEKENYDFLYQKYHLEEPYLDPEASCCSGGCGSPIAIPNATDNKKKIVIYVFGLLIILAMAARLVLKGFHF